MRWAIMALVVVGVMPEPARADLSLQFTSAQDNSAGPPETAGFSFTTTATVQVATLDFVGPLASGSAVRLYDGSGTTLASAVVLPTDPTESTGGFTYNVHTLLTPTTLTANTTYYVAGDYAFGQAHVLTQALNLATVPGITYGSGVLEFGGATNPTSDMVFQNSVDHAYLGVNFDLVPAVATPEPSTIALVVVGLPILLIVAHRRGRR